MDHGFSLKQNTHCCSVMQPHLPQFNKYCLASLQRLGCPWQLDTITPLMSHNFFFFYSIVLQAHQGKGIHSQECERKCKMHLFKPTLTITVNHNPIQSSYTPTIKKTKKKECRHSTPAPKSLYFSSSSWYRDMDGCYIQKLSN